MCGTAMDNTTVKACPTESFYGNCTAILGVVDIIPPHQKSVMAIYNNTLVENRNYLLTLTVNYNGGVKQQSQPLNISKCIIL